MAECPVCWTPLEDGHVCRCECGTILDEHGPLPRPGPLRSWHAERTGEPGTPKPPEQSPQLVRARDNWRHRSIA